MKKLLLLVIKFLKHKLYKPTHSYVIIRDIFNLHSTMNENMKCLKHAMNWLKYAQDINQNGGVSAGYAFRQGWLPSYPETTGYIIPTFLNYFHLTNEEEYFNRAIRMGDWIESIQLENGAFQGGVISESPKPVIFNTGQVLQGLVRIYKETGINKYIKGAIKAANWLIEVQDKDGSWRKFSYNNIPHTYHTKVAFALYELYKLTLQKEYQNAATKNIAWTLRNQKKNGWFKYNAFDGRSDPYLHTIAYAIEGLLDNVILSKNKIWLAAAIKPAEVLLEELNIRGTLSAVYSDKWKRTSRFRCLTGEAQMSVCWFRLFQLTNDERYLNTGLKNNKNLKLLQIRDSKNYGIIGGIKGSHPIWGKYQRFMYPNWAAKFFIDAIISEEKFKSKEKMWQ